MARLEDIEDALRMRAAESRGTTLDAMPAELVRRMLAGEHPVRLWREHRGLTRAELAKKAEIPPGYLSEIENGEKPGSTGAFRRLATALNAIVDDLLPQGIEEGLLEGRTGAGTLRFIRQDGIYNSTRETVSFYALRDRETVSFTITREVLEDRFGLKNGSKDEALRTFEKHRSRIEAIAAALHERGARRRDGYIVIDTKAVQAMKR